MIFLSLKESGVIESLIKLLNEQDKLNLEKITGYGFDEINDKIIKSKLNFLNNEKHIPSDLDAYGLHVIRCLLADKIDKQKRNNLISTTDSNYFDFINKGIIVLSNKDFNDDYVQKLLKMCLITNNLKFTNSRAVDSYANYDIQYGLHVDTFHMTIKAFQYKNDVGKANGPFSYVLSSNVIDDRKMKFLYDVSNNRSKNISLGLKKQDDHEKWTPSFRMGLKTYTEKGVEENLKKYGYDNETLIEAKSGTLIIADVSGLHRKFPCEKNHVRVTNRWTFNRDNPFK